MPKNISYGLKAALLLGLLFMAACGTDELAQHKEKTNNSGNGRLSSSELIEVAHSENQWTGIAISKEGRIFVNFPRWSPAVTTSVAELMPTGEQKAYPYRKVNDWNPTLSPGDHFVCVQSVYIDDEDYLWILDPANPYFRGVLEGGAKLLKVDLVTNEIIQKIFFDSTIAPASSYLNDVRIDTKKKVAYITDSGSGALITVDLVTEKSRRLLANHASTKSENIPLTIDGRQWFRPDGSTPSVHVDGITLDHEHEYLYYQALTGRTLYRIATKWLLDDMITDSELGEKVEFVSRLGAADGIFMGPDNNLYLTAIEDNAIKRITPQGVLEIVIKDPRIEWPDSFAFGPDGYIYFTISQIHLGAARQQSYKIFKFNPTL